MMLSILTILAVHAYRAFEKEMGRNCSFSYLDARNFRLRDDEDGVQTGDLRKEISISLKNLIKLHGCDIQNEKKNLCEEEYYNFFIEDLIPTYLNNQDDNKLKMALNEIYEKISKNCSQEMGFCLERYVYELLDTKISEDNELKDLHILLDYNWEAYNRESKKEFELDVIILNGYQVCGISCTISRREGDCKMKGFEVLHRVKQIGGEEGKAILISGLSGENVAKMAHDLKTISGSTDEKLLVLGRADWQEEILWNKIKDYIF